MIIDFHTHLAYYAIYPEKFIADMFPFDAKLNAKKITTITKIIFNDKAAEKQLRIMDSCEVERAVLIVLDTEVEFYPSKINYEENLKLHSDIILKNRNRFHAFAGFDPRRKNGLSIFKKAIEYYGYSGAKLYPPFGFSLNDKNLEPFFYYCNYHRIPILIHGGMSQASLHNKYAEPLHIYEVANKYQDIPFVLAHCIVFNETLRELSKIPNLSFDISGFQNTLRGLSPVERKNLYATIFTEEMQSKLIYGSDCPLFNLMIPIKNDIIEFETSLQELGKSKEYIYSLFYKNANKLLA